MPWQETLRMDQRVQFIADYQRDVFAVAELARRYDISRKTAYKWIDRYAAGGPAALCDRSRRPQHSPHAVAEPIAAAFLEARRRHPTWGARSCSRSSPHAIRRRSCRPAVPSSISGTVPAWSRARVGAPCPRIRDAR